MLDRAGKTGKDEVLEMTWTIHLGLCRLSGVIILDIADIINYDRR